MKIQELIEKLRKQLDHFDFEAINKLFSRSVTIQEDEDEYLDELEIIVGEIREILFREGNYSKAEVFLKTLQSYHPQIVDMAAVYFYDELITYFCSEGKFEQAEYYFEYFIADPFNDIGLYISNFKRFLFYQRNTIIMRAIKQNYQEFRADEAFAYGIDDFIENLIYFAETQAVYEVSNKLFDLKRLNESLEPINAAIPEAQAMAYHIGFSDEVPSRDDLKDLFAKNQPLFFELIRNIFLKRMLDKGWQFILSGIIFDLTRNYWERQQPIRKKPKLESYFRIKHKTFKRFLSFLEEKNLVFSHLEKDAIVWGIAYVYDFLSEVGVIDANQYNAFKDVYKLTVAETMGSSLDKLSDSSFVMQWPKHEAFTRQEWDAQKAIFKKSKICESDSSIDLVPYLKKELEVFGENEITILEAFRDTLETRNDLLRLLLSLAESENSEDEEDDYSMYDPDYIDVDHEEMENRKNIYSDTPYQAETKPGRNEPCPCGSGKKYKKCCGKAG